MQLIHPDPASARLGARAMTAIFRAGPVGPGARALLEAAQDHLLNLRFDPDHTEPISPEALAEGFSDPAARLQLIRGMIVVSLADGPPAPERMALVRAYADALEVDEAAVEALTRLSERHMLLFKLDFYRRSHLLDIVADQYSRYGGLWGVARGVLGQRGLVEDPALAARYQALGALPEGTLGRELWRHCRENGFHFPGEKGGFPEAGMYHDVSHVLSGYGTDPIGETLIAAFIGAYRRENPFHVVLFGVLTFSAGVNMTPIPQPASVSVLGEPGVAARWLRAIERGGRVNTDLSDHWAWWPHVERPIEELRAALGIEPE